MKKGKENIISYSLLENAFDFILSAFRFIAEGENRNIKYAILHLSAGLELVLKERIRREHWALVFEKTDESNVLNYKSGDFVSISYSTAIKRLKGICGIKFSEEDVKYLKMFRDKRNKLEHFGTIDTAEALKSATARVLSILLDFINNELEPEKFTPLEKHCLSEMRSSLVLFDEFVVEREKKQQKILEQHSKEVEVVECSACSREYFVTGDLSECLFCGHKGSPEDIAYEWVETVLGISSYATVKDGGEFPIYVCPECNSKTMVDTYEGLYDSECVKSWRFICFNCGQTWKDGLLGQCKVCTNHFSMREEDDDMCHDCLQQQIGKD